MKESSTDFGIDTHVLHDWYTLFGALHAWSRLSTTRDKTNLNKLCILRLARYRIGGPAAPQISLLPSGGDGPTSPFARGARSWTSLCASAHCPNGEGT